MRISDNMKRAYLLYNLNRTMERMIKTQRDLSSSKRIHRPSDDPSGTLQVMKIKNYLSRYERYQKNVEDGYQWLIATESSLTNLENILTEVNNVLLRGSSETVVKMERENLSKHLRSLWYQVVQTANQMHGDKYMFGGTNNDTSPYEITNEIEDELFTAVQDNAVVLENIYLSSGSVTVTTTDGLTEFTEGTDYTIDYEYGTITVLGSGSMTDGDDYLISYETEENSEVELNPDGVDGVVYRNIDAGLNIQINVSADDVFGGTDGPINVVKKAYIAFKRDDRDGIREAMSSLENSLTQISKIHNGEVGVKINRLETLKLKLSTDIATYERLKSGIEDADIAAAVTELQNDQVVFQAALKSGANIIQSTLLDYL